MELPRSAGGAGEEQKLNNEHAPSDAGAAAAWHRSGLELLGELFFVAAAVRAARPIDNDALMYRSIDQRTIDDNAQVESAA